MHVLAGATKITARLVETEKYYTIEGVVAFDDKNDLVILKILEQDKPFSLGDSNTIQKRDTVCVVGYSDGKENSVERTIYSIRYFGKHIILDNKLSAGNSGGPVLNDKDEVIGIAEALTEKLASNKTHRVKVEPFPLIILNFYWTR
ncbi:trypsin-like peptidase domain-containing protein [Candidatus Poribacteria bacterium]|nr:trypsin-like peptidase domain-containing protein [Candidatus Poribacteria bacterium]